MSTHRHVFVSLLGAGALIAAVGAAAAPVSDKPTIVLVHGAFAGSSSWNGVIQRLQKDGYPVIAAANGLRGVESDAASVSSLVKSIAGPVVLAGHSYGGAVITTAANGNPNVKALVYVAAFAPDTGETSLGLSGQFPGSTLGEALAPPVSLPDGRHDLYIDEAKFPAQFAHDVPPETARVMAAEQRPVTQEALAEPSGPPAWKHLPSWSIYGSGDRNIPPAALAFMAKRAASRKVVVVPDASHVVMTSHPDAVAELIEEAAAAR